ncbi:MAG: hypothetical protein KGO81_08710 [Bacteroidota bacterium]|nr:hypothetical protein [Bacteroidota bacterium]
MIGFKNISIYILLILFFLSSCKKKVGNSLFSETASTHITENLGHAFTSNNVLWAINPLAPNQSALITYHPHSRTGYEAILIDYGPCNNNTPVNAFKIISANLNTGSYSTIKIIDNNTKTEVTTSLGRITRYIWGKNLKLYLATEGSYNGGGHLIEYDPNNQIAIDLGKPFFYNNKYLDIYSLNVGADNALYGGSFGGSGDVAIFKYDYAGNFTLSNNTLDQTSRYVSYISADDNYIYASCGENNWNLYAIEKKSGKSYLLTSITGSISRIELFSFTDGVYAKWQSNFYQLSNLQVNALLKDASPTSNLVQYTPYTLNESNSLKVSWDGTTQKLSFILNGVNSFVSIPTISNDIYPIGTILLNNQTLYATSLQHGLISTYTNATKWQSMGNVGFDIYDACLTNSGNHIYIGGYPKGNVWMYDFTKPWDYVPLQSNVTLGNYNPALLSMVQNGDANNVNGPMYVSKLLFFKTNILVCAGDNDRITSSSGRALSVSTIKNGITQNFFDNSWNNYVYSDMCADTINDNAIIAAAGTNQSMLYIFSPTNSRILSAIPFPNYTPGKITFLNNHIIAGCFDDVIYLFDLSTKKIVWQQSLGNGQRIYAIASKGNDVFIIHMYLQATHFKLLKYSFNQSTSGFKSTVSTIAELSDQDNCEATKPQSLIIQNNGLDSCIYVTGLKSLYRIK